jgi:hypothetical protein
MTNRIIVIQNCYQCPYVRLGKKDRRCELNGIAGTHLYKIIPDPDVFPDFCPLDKRQESL